MARTSTGLVTSGFDNLEQKLFALANPTIATKIGQAATRKAMKTVGEPALKRAAPDGPNQDGEVRGRRVHAKIKTSIKVRKGRSKQQQAVVTLVTFGRAFHAIFQEKGTAKMPPHPFAKPAMEGVAQQIIDATGVELGKMIDNYVRRNP